MVVESDCCIAESYDILRSSMSTRKDYLSAFEKLCMQYAEAITLARYDIKSLSSEKIISMIVLIDLLKMKLN